MSMDFSNSFHRKRTIKYFLHCIQLLPQAYSSNDSNRVTLLFFALSGLDLCNGLSQLPDDLRHASIEWLYSLQVTPSSSTSSSSIEEKGKYGFQGSSYLGPEPPSEYALGHLAMTYTALATLIILGDDLSRVNRPAILSSIVCLQQEDGSFSATVHSENDMRFLYCSCVISAFLNDWSAINQDNAVAYIQRSIGYDGGIAQGPGQEPHGGSTFCALASLAMMNRLDSVFNGNRRSLLESWLFHMQSVGFHGRTNKPDDTCYSFWVGASLDIIGMYGLVDDIKNASFLASTASAYGGYAKWPDCHPDVLHSYFGVCSHALMGAPEVKKLNVYFNISQSAAARLIPIHKRWKSEQT